MPTKDRLPALLGRGLPPARLAALPAPVPWLSLVGPGVIMVATSLGSGEIFFWPDITMRHGFTLLWAALLALFLQYVINTEIARYTLATGETIVTGFARLARPLAWVFLAWATLPWLWPGWSAGCGATLSWVIGGSPEWIAAASLVVIGVVLTGSRVVYRAVERIQVVLIAFTLLVILGLVVALVPASTYRAFVDGLTSAPRVPEGLEVASLLAALAFCGAGGSINLATSHWTRDKGFGMGARVPRVISPLTGDSVARASMGYFFTPTEENRARWRRWWREARREQTVTFLVTGAAGLVLLMLLAHALLHGRADLDGRIEMLRVEGRVVAERSAPWLRQAFYLMAAAVFFTSAVGVLDHVARLSADILKTNVGLLRESSRPALSESGLYFVVLWAMIAFAVGVLLVANLTDPPTLLRIAGSLSGIVMFFYSGLLLVLFARLRRDVDAVSPEFGRDNPFRLPPWRRAALAVALLFYGTFSFVLVAGLLG